MADERLFAEVQQISAGSQFDGSLPSTTPVDDEGVRVYPADSQGGMVDPEHVSPMLIKRLSVGGGGSADWTITITDGNTVVNLLEETGVDVLRVEDLAVLPVGWHMEVVSSGAASAMTLWCEFQRAHIVLY